MKELVHNLEGIGAFILAGAFLNLIQEEAVAYSLLLFFAVFVIVRILKERVN